MSRVTRPTLLASMAAVVAALLLLVAGQAQAQPSLASGTFLYGITFDAPYKVVEYNPLLNYKKVLWDTGNTNWDANGMALDNLKQRLYFMIAGSGADGAGLYVYDLRTKYHARIATPADLGITPNDPNADPLVYDDVAGNGAFWLDSYWFIPYGEPGVLRRVAIAYDSATGKTTGIKPYTDYALSPPLQTPNPSSPQDIAFDIPTKTLYIYSRGFWSVDVSNLAVAQLPVTTIVPYDVSKPILQIAFDGAYSTLWGQQGVNSVRGQWVTLSVTTGAMTLYPFDTSASDYFAADLAGGNFRSGSACPNVILTTNLDPMTKDVAKGLVKYKRVPRGRTFKFSVTMTSLQPPFPAEETVFAVALPPGVTYVRSRVSAGKTLAGTAPQYDPSTGIVTVAPGLLASTTSMVAKRKLDVVVKLPKDLNGHLIGFQAYFTHYSSPGVIDCVTGAGGAIDVGPKKFYA